MLELLDCPCEGGCLRTVMAVVVSSAECIGRPVHAMGAIAGGGGARQARYSIVEEEEQREQVRTCPRTAQRPGNVHCIVQ